LTQETSQAPVDKAGSARKILRRAPKGSLGTLDGDTRLPYVSLVLCATDPNGAPLFLISKLARHTQNLLKNEQACLMLDDTEGLDEPLTGGRLSVSGSVKPCADPVCRQRFLARHESSALYADFADFAFYRLEICHGHYVGGFGAIHDFDRGELLTDASEATNLFAHEPEIIEHMNSEHGDVVGLIACKLNEANAGPWRLTGIDSLGCDLMLDFNAIRHEFHRPVETADDARQMFIELATLARKSA